jgi:hypothetical protein
LHLNSVEVFDPMLFPPIVPGAGIILLDPLHQCFPHASAFAVDLSKADEELFRLKPVLEVTVDFHLNGPGEARYWPADDTCVSSKKPRNAEPPAVRALNPSMGMGPLDVTPIPKAAIGFYLIGPSQPEALMVHLFHSAGGTRIWTTGGACEGK